jgi:SAM-dependent methyltransferase
MATSSTTPTKVNLGSGSKRIPGFTNLDRMDIEGVDIVHDLDVLPLPFADNSIQEILCQDILEHVEYIPLLKEIHRILAPGGSVRIRVPHYTSRNNYTDPTHKKRFSISTFDYFSQGTYVYERRQGQFFFDFVFSKLSEQRINFDKKSSIVLRGNSLIEWWVNLRPRNQLVYEMTNLHTFFPASDISITLTK